MSRSDEHQSAQGESGESTEATSLRAFALDAPELPERPTKPEGAKASRSKSDKADEADASSSAVIAPVRRIPVAAKVMFATVLGGCIVVLSLSAPKLRADLAPTPVLAISGATRQGIEPLLEAVWDLLHPRQE